MALITSYSTLQTEIASRLNRADLTTSIPGFIQDFESEGQHDERLRQLVEQSPFSVSGDNTALPADFAGMEALNHDGSTYFGPIEITTPGALARIKARYGTTTGVPVAAAIVNKRLRFAPVPDQSYALKLFYWRSFLSLSATVTSNWLLLARPDIYLYGSLVSSAPFLKDDNRLGVWRSELDRRIETFRQGEMNRQIGGGGSVFQYRPIGG